VVRQADGPYEGGIGEGSREAVFGQEGYAEAVERLAGVVELYGKRVDDNQLTSGGWQQRWSHFVASGWAPAQCASGPFCVRSVKGLMVPGFGPE
jgi:hypothetical protein